MKCPDEALRTGLLVLVDRMIELNSGAPQAYALGAFLCARFGRHEQSRANIRRTLELKPQNAYAWYQCALVNLLLDEPESFQDVCGQMVKSFVETDDVRNARLTAWTCALMPDAVDNYDACVRLAEIVLSSDSNNGLYLGILGAILFRAALRGRGRSSQRDHRQLGRHTSHVQFAGLHLVFPGHVRAATWPRRGGSENPQVIMRNDRASESVDVRSCMVFSVRERVVALRSCFSKTCEKIIVMLKHNLRWESRDRLLNNLASN